MPQECHALEWPEKIDRASRAFVLAASTYDTLVIVKPDFPLSLARRAVTVADAEGDALAQAAARAAYGTTLARRASAAKASLLPALEVLRDALRRTQAATREEDVRVLSVLLPLATANRDNGTYAAAMKRYREALEIARKIDEETAEKDCRCTCPPQTARVQAGVRRLCEADHEPACDFLKTGFRCIPGFSWDESCPGRRPTPNPTKKRCRVEEPTVDPKPVGRRWNLALEALEFAKAGKTKEAEIYARVALEVWEGSWNDLAVVEAKIALAHVFSLRGEHRKAITELDMALMRAEQAESPNPELRANVLLHSAAERSTAPVNEARIASRDVHEAFELCDTGEESQEEFLQRFCTEGCRAACKLSSLPDTPSSRSG